VGQKTHPTGFLTGVNKSHNAVWFANYGAYSEVLKEDDKIRKFFEKKFGAIYGKAGIAKLEIQRKVNQLELIIHAARPKAIASETDQNNLIVELKDSLKSLVSGSKQIRIKVLQVAKSENESSLVEGPLLTNLKNVLLSGRQFDKLPRCYKKVVLKGLKFRLLVD